MTPADETLSLRLQLELLRGHQPIAGRVTAPPELAREFHGWIELSALLEAARTREGPGTDRP